MAGLRALGYDVRLHPPARGQQEGNVLLTWNRYEPNNSIADGFEEDGGTVIVAENAYLGLDRGNRTRYAMAVGGHNGGGFWPLVTDGGARWRALGIEVKPWRTEGEHVLVCPNRSFGRPGYIMPLDWAEKTAAQLRGYTSRPVRVRAHPGNGAPKTPLEDDLRNAWAVVIWASSVGCESLVRGIPTYSMAPAWVCKPATCTGGLRTINAPTLPDRMPALHSLAWAQWELQEIQSGEAFQHLLKRPCAFQGGL